MIKYKDINGINHTYQAGAGYIRSKGVKFNDILDEKIKATDIALDKYQQFLIKNQINIEMKLLIL